MRWWKESSKVLVVLASAALVSACSLFSAAVKDPEVNVADVRVLGMSLADAQIAVELDVKNPNGIGLSLQGLSYRLALQDQPLFNGSLSEKLEVVANGSSRVTLPFTVRYEDVLGSVLGLAQSKEIKYQITGQADFGILKLPYSRSGTLSLPRLPDISVKSLNINNITLAGVELALGLNVSNANSFPVRLDGMNYDLKIAGAPLLKGESTQGMSVNANGSSDLTLSMTLSYAQLGELAQVLGSADSLPVEFSSRVNTPGVKQEAAVIPYQWKGDVPLMR